LKPCPGAIPANLLTTKKQTSDRSDIDGRLYMTANVNRPKKDLQVISIKDRISPI